MEKDNTGEVEFSRHLVLVVSPIVALIALIGNTCLIGIIAWKPELRNFTGSLLVSLAITYLCCALRQILHTASVAVGSWQFGMYGCYLDSTAYGVFLIASSIFIVILSLTCLISNRWPMPLSNNLKLRLIVIISIGGWILSAIYIVPYLLYTDIDATGAFCVVDWSKGRSLYLYTLFMGFVLPVSILLIIFVLYLIDMCYAAKCWVNCTCGHDTKEDTCLVVALVLTHVICRIPLYLLFMSNALPSVSLTQSISAKNYVVANVVFEIMQASSTALSPWLCLCLKDDLRSLFLNMLSCILQKLRPMRKELPVDSLGDLPVCEEIEVPTYRKPKEVKLTSYHKSEEVELISYDNPEEVEVKSYHEPVEIEVTPYLDPKETEPALYLEPLGSEPVYEELEAIELESYNKPEDMEPASYQNPEEKPLVEKESSATNGKPSTPIVSTSREASLTSFDAIIDAYFDFVTYEDRSTSV